jgi:ATP synthase protein I
MTLPDGAPPDEDSLLTQVKLRTQRELRWLQDGDVSVARRLSQIGVLGWIIVTPMLLGVFLGRWIDAKFGSGIFWTAPLLFLGMMLGSWSAWKWMQSK